MSLQRKEKIRALLKGIETGDPAAVAVVNQDQYIQHNPQTEEGGEGLAVLFKRLAKRSPKVNVVRLFCDGDFVFGQTEYDFGSPRVGFEVFRFEGDFTVEHWDNIQPRQPSCTLGLTMVDGPTEAVDRDKTESNRQLVASFVTECLVGRDCLLARRYLASDLVDHSAAAGEEPPSVLRLATTEAHGIAHYERMHRVLAEGNFVLSVCEGTLSGAHSSFYDLFRVDDGLLVEHWSTTEAVPPRSEWKNDNGKF